MSEGKIADEKNTPDSAMNRHTGSPGDAKNPKPLPTPKSAEPKEDTKSLAKARNEKAFPTNDAADVLKARKEGHLEAIKESAKAVYASGADQEYGGPVGTQRFQGPNDVAHIQDFVNLPEDQLKDLLDGNHVVGAITEARVAGLLEVERSGQNRSHVVDMLCKHLKIDSPYEATDAGPAYTNDTSMLKPVKPRPEPKA